MNKNFLSLILFSLSLSSCVSYTKSHKEINSESIAMSFKFHDFKRHNGYVKIGIENCSEQSIFIPVFPNDNWVSIKLSLYLNGETIVFYPNYDYDWRFGGFVNIGNKEIKPRECFEVLLKRNDFILFSHIVPPRDDLVIYRVLEKVNILNFTIEYSKGSGSDEKFMSQSVDINLND